MSLASLVLAFAGAMAAKVKPAERDSGRLARHEALAGAQLLAEVVAERDALQDAVQDGWRRIDMLEAENASLRRGLAERDRILEDVPAYLEHRRQLSEVQRQYAQYQNMAAQQQANQAQLQQMAQAQQNAYYNQQAQGQLSALGLQQGLQGLNLAQAQAQVWGDCTCVPGRSAVLRAMRA